MSSSFTNRPAAALTYLDSFDPFPGPELHSLESIPTYKNDISESGIT